MHYAMEIDGPDKNNELEIIQVHTDNGMQFTIKKELSELAGYDNVKTIQDIVQERFTTSKLSGKNISAI